jgi:hypothetical protein
VSRAASPALGAVVLARERWPTPTRGHLLGAPRLRELGEPITITPLTCVECGRPWFDPDERWRSRLDVDDKAWLFCPDCDEEEFGDS